MRRIATSAFLLIACQFLHAQDIDFNWARDFQGGTTISQAITVDAAGNVYTTGEFTGTVDFDPGPGVFTLTQAATGAGGYISKLDANGNFVWAKQFQTTDMSSTAIALDAVGNIYTTGYFQGIVDFDPGVPEYYLSRTGNGSDAFVCKLDNDGNFIWAKQFNSPNNTVEAHSLAVNAAGDVYTAGIFYGQIDLDPGTNVFNITAVALNDVYLSKLDANGNFVWGKQIGGLHTEQATSLCLDQSGNLYATGYFSGSTDFDPGNGTFNITPYSFVGDVFILKLNPAGTFIWVKRIGAGGNAYSLGRGITTDPSNNIYVIGYYDLACDLDPGTNEFNVTSLSGSEDVFLVKLDNDGNFIWGKTMGGNLDDRGEAVHTDIAGNVYTTGNFSAAADFDPGTAIYNLTSGSENDIFISKLDPSGNFIWAKQFRGSTGTNAGLSLATDLSLNVYTTGTFVHTVDFDPATTDYILSASAIPSAFIHKMGHCRNSTTNNIIATSCGPYSLNNQLYTASGTYTQTLPNAAGCDSIISLRLTVNGSITNTTVTACEPYTWEGQTFTISGHHSITFPLASGCDSVLNLDLTIASPPVDFLKPLDSICQNENLQIHSLHTYITYEWSTGSDQPFITVTSPGAYDLSVKDENGCTGSSSITILPRSCYPDIIFPTAFSPNGDQLNDVFKTIINKVVISYKLEVFNRNGQLVFRSTDPEKGWNGTINGTPASTAVFVWQCIYQLPGEKKKFQKGTVALIK